MTLILLAGIVLECVVLVILGLLKKWTKIPFLVIAAATAACMIVVGVQSRITTQQEVQRDSREALYMSARLIQEDAPTKSILALATVTNEENAEETRQSVQLVRGLAYNLSGSYGVSASYLADASTAGNTEAEQIIAASKAAEPAEEGLVTSITEAVLAEVAATEQEVRQWEAEMKVRFLGISLSEEEQAEAADTLTTVKSDIAQNRYEEAYTAMTAIEDDTTVTDDIIVSQMYVENYNSRKMAEADEAYGTLWQAAVEKQVALNRAALLVSDDEADDSTDSADAEGSAEEAAYQNYLLAQAEYEVAMDDLQKESVKRSIRYLTASTPSADQEIGYQLQLARLYFADQDQENARACLVQIFTADTLDESLWLGADAAAFKEAYIIYLSDTTNTEYNTLFDTMMSSLYQNLFEDDDYESFKNFVKSCMKELFGGLIIRSVDTDAFPMITAEVSATADDLVVSRDTLRLIDTGNEISDFTVTQEEQAQIDISIVLDRSGSMQGDNLADSKSAIRSLLSGLTDGARVSFVTFSTEASIESELTSSKYGLINLVESVVANGGTNIASRLEAGVSTLQGASGTKYIVLLSDGIDGNDSQSLINSVISDAGSNGIVVYCIGLEGCDTDYLQRISSGTGGQFIMAENTSELVQIYADIQEAMLHNYTITYEAADEAEDRQMQLQSTEETLAEARKDYSASEGAEESTTETDDVQQSSYYRQIGGTGSGR